MTRTVITRWIRVRAKAKVRARVRANPNPKVRVRVGYMCNTHLHRRLDLQQVPQPQLSVARGGEHEAAVGREA